MPKKCHRCRIRKRYSEFNKSNKTKDGYRGWCRDCTKADWMDYSKRGNTKKNGSYLYWVIYDPLESFTKNSAFTRNEIEDMLHDEYLAIGTRFRRGKYEYRVNDDLCLTRETAGVAASGGVRR